MLNKTVISGSQSVDNVTFRFLLLRNDRDINLYEKKDA